MEDATHSHKPNTGALQDVIDAFDAQNIVLHIDDGSMGGGGSIGYEEYITFGQDDPAHPEYPDFYDDYKNGGQFSNNRDDIFHYVIFCDKCWADSGGGFNSNRAGRGEINGDDFVVCSSQSPYTFIHELGHNLDLSHSMESDGSFPYADYTSENDAKKSVMFYSSAQATNGYTYDELWKYIDLKGVSNPLDGD